MGAGTFTQLYIQLVFAVRGRQNLILQSWEDDLYKYITGIIQQKGQKLLAINGMPDHIHILIGMKPTCCLSDLVREVKKSSNKFIKENKFVTGKFEWQEGFGAFSYSHSAFSNVIRYIDNQKQHHRNNTFRDEYIELLRQFDITYKEDYLFEWISKNDQNEQN